MAAGDSGGAPDGQGTRRRTGGARRCAFLRRRCTVLCERTRVLVCDVRTRVRTYVRKRVRTMVLSYPCTTATQFQISRFRVSIPVVLSACVSTKVVWHTTGTLRTYHWYAIVVFCVHVCVLSACDTMVLEYVHVLRTYTCTRCTCDIISKTT